MPINKLWDASFDSLKFKTISSTQLATLIANDNPGRALCGEGFWTVLEVPIDEIQALRDLQSTTCAANQTVAMWQTIMFQANGHQLHQQVFYMFDYLPHILMFI